jgi:hypothetical protein
MRHCFTILLLLCVSSTVLGQGGTGGTDRTLVNDHYDFIAANRMLMWMSNNGKFSHNPMSDGSGVEWPAGSGKFLVFTEGLVYGGKVEGEIRIGGATYRPGWEAGRLLHDGTPDDPNAPRNRVFRAHRFNAAWWNTRPTTERTRILTDLLEWPVQSGAPWIDADGNGTYDPDTAVWVQGGVCDAPRIPGDEAFWFVSNDLDASRTSRLYGTRPIGLEVQTMVWATAGHPLLDNVVFREYTLINKGIDDVTDMYLGAWEDPDMGEAFDDFSGVDTALGLAYTYNGIKDDEVYGIPPATGVLWLQRPVHAQPGSTARYGLGIREGYANLPLSSFAHYINGSSTYMDPALGAPQGAVHMMNYLSGKKWDGVPFVDPTTGTQVAFTLAGDPILAKGWIDGLVHVPGDRRQISSCGPFTLAVGDTQKVILARIAVEADDNLLGVRALRNAARQLRDIYRNIPMGTAAPAFTSNIRFPGSDAYELHVSGGPFPPSTLTAEAELRRAGAVIRRIPLYDDGTHGDTLAGDGIYSATWTDTVIHAEGADLVVVSRSSGVEREWFVDSEIPLAGAAAVRIADIASDNRSFDGIANPGENIHVRIRFLNQSPNNLGPWHLFLRDSASLEADWTVLRHPVSIPAGGSTETIYDPGSTNTYLSITIPENTAGGTTVLLPVTLLSENYCLWNDTLRIDVVANDTISSHGLLAHVEGNASGSLGYVITRPESLTEHDYRVRVDGEDFGTKTLRIEDVTLNQTLRSGLEIPNRLVHSTPEVDGWRVTIGTAFDMLVYNQQGERLMSFTEKVRGEFSAPARSWFTIYEDDLLTGEEATWGSRLKQYDEIPVRLVFDRTNGQKALRYVRGMIPNYSFQGYFNVPLRAYDIRDTVHPRQLMIGFNEQKGRPSCDSNFALTTEPIDREYLFVFADDYTEQPSAKFLEPLSTGGENLDMLYFIWAIRDATAPMFEDGDAYTITAPVPVSNRDVYILARPRLLGVTSEATRPSSIALHAVYPNPVNPGSANGTVIRFDTPREGHARVAVYDLLGRRVSTVVDQTLPAGTHAVRFDARALRAGTYVIALEAEGERAARRMTILR